MFRVTYQEPKSRNTAIGAPSKSIRRPRIDCSEADGRRQPQSARCCRSGRQPELPLKTDCCRSRSVGRHPPAGDPSATFNALNGSPRSCRSRAMSCEQPRDRSTLPWHQRGRPLHELQRRHHQVRGAVAPGHLWAITAFCCLNSMTAKSSRHSTPPAHRRRARRKQGDRSIA
jgi:hypothetical protein